MPRNRIYPVGCAQALLLDFFGIEWKQKAQAAGEEFTFAALFEDHLGVEDAESAARLGEAKETYHYDAILSATHSVLRDYEASYARELEAFEDQPGYRFEIQMSSKNLKRSRSSTAKKWFADRGGAEFRRHFDVYSLESASDGSLLLQVRNAGVLERNDWAAKTKVVVFFVPDVPSIRVDRAALADAQASVRFARLDVIGEALTITCERAGTVARRGNRVVVNLFQ
jgi:hypothetical protein